MGENLNTSFVRGSMSERLPPPRRRRRRRRRRRVLYGYYQLLENGAKKLVKLLPSLRSVKF